MTLSEEELVLYELAFLLKMPVYKILEEMPNQELSGWLAYLDMRPPGWQEDLRVGYLLQAFGEKRKVTEIFPSVATVLKPKASSAAESLKHSPVYQFMKNAVGGDKPEFL